MAVKPDEKNEADLAFEELAAIVPERGDVDEDESEPEGHKKTLDEALNAPNLSDAQAAMKYLFPDTGYPHLNLLQMSEVFPDSFIPFQSMLVKDLLSKDQTLSLTEAITICSTAESIAFSREGRIDLITLQGAAKERDMRDAEKGLGLH